MSSAALTSMRASSLALLATLALACEADPPPLTPVEVELPSVTLPKTDGGVAVERELAPAEPVCRAPSLDAEGPLDRRDEAALENCQSPATGPGKAAKLCGQRERDPRVDLEALEEAVLPFDRATREHLREIAKRGRELGRKPRVFGLVGDSMTVSGAFMRPLTDPKQTRLSPQIEATLWSDVAKGSIIEWYRGEEVERFSGRFRDSFTATRAAKVGARTLWAAEGGAMSPIGNMVKRLSPAVAIVLFGGNDAAYRIGPLDQLADRFEADLGRVIDQLEEAGVIPVLNTIARHGDSPGYRNCGSERQMSDWRMAVQTNVLSARAAEMACKRHLPLLDVRHAMDSAVNMGVGNDGVHPSYFARGPGVMDAQGLRCGYNVRNYVTMRMLAQVVDEVLSDD
jgi:lysophospholipase L1-like esterase